MNSALKNISKRKVFTGRATFAANAGASVLASIAVRLGHIVSATAKIFGSAGVSAVVPVVADATADTLTATAHGLLTGMPCIITGGTLPTGVTAATVYYLNKVDADTLKLYNTQANAVTGGATGLIDITAAGEAVVVQAVTLNAVYGIQVAAKNQVGKAALIGTASVSPALEDVSGWDATAAINDTADTIELKVTPDTVLATRFYYEVEVISVGALL